MSTQLVNEGPRFVAPYQQDNGGVDFLGLRQVNLELMALCLPGINNVTRYIRPFSLLSWIYWKFYGLAEKKGTTVTNKDLQMWKEKVETLFTRGHKIQKTGGIPGTDSEPPGKGPVPLTFAAWKRSAQNTSLMAAVQYGPATKTIDGLGFLESQGRGFFQTRGHGVELAEALDVELRRFDLLKKLDVATANARQAERIFPSWSIFQPSTKERRIFRRAFFDASTIGDSTPIGRRSSTLQIALNVLAYSQKPLTSSEIRSLMFRRPFSNSRSRPKHSTLNVSWLRWVVLQVRQSQRLAFEGLLSWFELQLVEGNNDTEAIVNATLAAIKDHHSIFPLRQPRYFLKLIRKNFSTLDQALANRRDLDPFWLMEQISQATIDRSDSLGPYCLRTLFICSAFTELLLEESTVKGEVERGGSDRLSLAFWVSALSRFIDRELPEFLRFFFETFVLSQHFAVAARRFDGQTQRLRISIEEEGLEFLVDEPLLPTVTADRLNTALSLMEDCGLIGWSDEPTGYVAK
jgi:hypothetical protein